MYGDYEALVEINKNRVLIKRLLTDTNQSGTKDKTVSIKKCLLKKVTS